MPQLRIKVEKEKLVGIDEIPAQLVQAEGNTLCSKIPKFVRHEEELPEQWKESVIVPVYKKGEETDYLLIWVR
jgi:hypothetical protein